VCEKGTWRLREIGEKQREKSAPKTSEEPSKKPPRAKRRACTRPVVDWKRKGVTERPLIETGIRGNVSDLCWTLRMVFPASETVALLIPF